MENKAGIDQVFEYVPKGPKVVWGRGCSTLLSEELRRIGAKRALIVCGRKVGASRWLAGIRKQLGEACVGVFGDVEPHTPLETLQAGVASAKAVSPDCIVAVGGGSAQDAGKLIALMLAEGPNLEAFKVTWLNRELQIPVLRNPKIPVIGIPTTLSAAEVIGAAVYVTGDKRYVIVDPAICPKAVFFDSEIAVTTPVGIFLGTGLNALAHCVEAIYSKKAQPISDALSLGALRLLVQSLLTCSKEPTNIAARQDAQLGACMSGLAYSNTWLGIAHSLSQALGARYRVSHGVVNAVILPHAMRFNLPVTQAKQDLIANAMADLVGTTSGSSRRGASQVVDQFNSDLGLPRRLRDIGVPQSGLRDVAEDGFKVWHTYFNPRRVESADELQEVLKEAW